MKVVFVESDRCLGCRSCEQVCAFQKGGGFKKQDANIWVRVDMQQRFITTSTCMHCETAPCLQSCPSGAVERDNRTDAVKVDAAECIGCRVCVTACPFGNMHFDPIGRVAAKCDLCGGEPKCVAHCMAKALHYGDINELARTRRALMDRAERSRAAAPGEGRPRR